MIRQRLGNNGPCRQNEMAAAAHVGQEQRKVAGEAPRPSKALTGLYDARAFGLRARDVVFIQYTADRSVEEIPIMRWFAFFRKQPTAPRTRAAKRLPRPPRFRPRVEALEDRLLLNAGALDPTFGNGGIVSTLFKGGGAVGTVLIQPDHKIIVASVDSGFAVARYLENGSLDTTFGRGGILIPSITGNEEAAALQSDGKILVVGFIRPNKTTQQMVMDRYNANGTLDTSFGNNGMVTTNFAGGSLAHAVVIQPDGKIVLGGISSGFAFARFNPNGTVDSSFGTNGQDTVSLNGGSGWLTSMALQSDGKIVAVGDWQPVGQSLAEFAIARFTSTGALDTSFGGTGFVLDNPGSLPAVLRDVVVQPDGKIVTTGQVPSPIPGGAGDFGVLRYNSDGTSDTTFGVNGLADIAIPGSGYNSDPYALALQSDGKILVGGTTQPWSQSDQGAFALARINPNGSLDSTFGTSGEVTTAVGPPAQINALAIQPWNGDIVAAGYATVGRGSGFTLARYLGDPVTAPFMLSALEPATSPTSTASSRLSPGGGSVSGHSDTSALDSVLADDNLGWLAIVADAALDSEIHRHQIV